MPRTSMNNNQEVDGSNLQRYMDRDNCRLWSLIFGYAKIAPEKEADL